MWIFPKIADFGIFDGFLAKNPPELSGDAVPTEHQIHGKGVIFGYVTIRHPEILLNLHSNEMWFFITLIIIYDS